jgi:hypothetical protein
MVARYHDALVGYTTTNNPLFLIRMMRGITRGHIYETAHDVRLKGTDNAPAWWMHYAAFHEMTIDDRTVADIITGIPVHFFDVSAQIPDNISAAGWHVAHLFSVKNGDTEYQDWERAELTARFIRNVHPCNYFLVPKPAWRQWGSDLRILGYIARHYADRYASIWDDFITIARANMEMDRFSQPSGPIAYTYKESRLSERLPPSVSTATLSSTQIAPASDDAVTYKVSRLLFKASVIEPLELHQRFRIVTPVGSFEMTKADFYRTFSNVIRTASYREGGTYHYPIVPRVALQFLVSLTPD